MPRPIERSQLIDKEGLAAKLLECAEQKLFRGGQVHYANDGEDRLGFLRSYSEVIGFVGKTSIGSDADNLQRTK
jgi:hypothetical protein